ALHPLDAHTVLRSSALPPNRSAGDPRDVNCSSRLESSGSSRGSARSVASKDTPMLSAVKPGPCCSAPTVIVASSPETAPANDWTNSVGVGLGSAVWSAEGEEPSESDQEHPVKSRARATTAT